MRTATISCLEKFGYQKIILGQLPETIDQLKKSERVILIRERVYLRASRKQMISQSALLKCRLVYLCIALY